MRFTGSELFPFAVSTTVARTILTGLVLSAGTAFVPEALAQAQSPAQLEEIVVEGEVEAYTVTRATTATRSETPIADTPLSIQVVPRQLIEDQNVTRLKDIYRNVSGVAPQRTEGFGLQFENAYIRGFSQLLSVDEVNLYTVPPLNVAGIQRVEVLKGPASSLYGAVEPGGLINVIPKKASFTRHNEVYGEYGTDEFYRAGFDTGGPVGENVAFRLVGDFLDHNSFRDFLHNRSVFFSPSMLWNISDRTRLATWLWYQHLERPYDNGVAFTFDGRP
ncbi:MAG: TonB-dependent receptor, partial [Chthoniobacteraceae bacterium]